MLLVGRSPTIPVVLEKTVEGIRRDELVRLIYFQVEGNGPMLLNFANSFSNLQLLMISTVGVVLSPSETKKYFSSPTDLEAFIEEVESFNSFTDGATFSVGSDSIVMPLHMLDEGKSREYENARPERGDVFRISVGAFLKARQFSESLITKREYFDFLTLRTLDRPFGVGITYSAEETKAFSEWCENTLRGM